MSDIHVSLPVGVSLAECVKLSRFLDSLNTYVKDAKRSQQAYREAANCAFGTAFWFLHAENTLPEGDRARIAEWLGDVGQRFLQAGA